MKTSPLAQEYTVLKNLCIVAEDQIYGCLETALEAKGLGMDVAKILLESFYKGLLGLETRTTRCGLLHVLINKSTAREWLGTQGEVKIAYGTIARCYISLLPDKALQFKVVYHDRSRKLIPGLPKCDELVSLEDAWGGYLTGLELEHGRSVLPADLPPHRKFIVPRMRTLKNQGTTLFSLQM
jgi:hypothetical protein